MRAFTLLQNEDCYSHYAFLYFWGGGVDLPICVSTFRAGPCRRQASRGTADKMSLLNNQPHHILYISSCAQCTETKDAPFDDRCASTR